MKTLSCLLFLFFISINLNASEGAPKKKKGRRIEKRLIKELSKISESESENYGAFPAKDIYHWRAFIIGPKGTPYEDLRFELGLDFSNSYPFEAPKVIFLSSCYHPNIYLKNGEVCVDILKEAWSPSLSIESLLVSLQSLLAQPNLDSPLNGEAVRFFESTSKKQYRKRVQQIHKTQITDHALWSPYLAPTVVSATEIKKGTGSL